MSQFPIGLQTASQWEFTPPDVIGLDATPHASQTENLSQVNEHIETYDLTSQNSLVPGTPIYQFTNSGSQGEPNLPVTPNEQMEDIDAPSQILTFHNSSQPEGSSSPSAAQWLQQGTEDKLSQTSQLHQFELPQTPVAGTTQTEYSHSDMDILFGEEEPPTPTPTP